MRQAAGLEYSNTYTAPRFEFALSSLVGCSTRTLTPTNPYLVPATALDFWPSGKALLSNQPLCRLAGHERGHTRVVDPSSSLSGAGSCPWPMPGLAHHNQAAGLPSVAVISMGRLYSVRIMRKTSRCSVFPSALVLCLTVTR
jgi:hypothetical protein